MSRSNEHAPLQLTDCLALSYVPRWSIIPQTHTQSVAEHSHRVAVIMLELADRLKLELPYSLLVWALVHDGPEAWTGDIPGPFKHADQGFQDAKVAPWHRAMQAGIDLGEDQHWRQFFKIADLIETGTYIGKFGVGWHAVHAAGHIINVELPDQVKKWCLAFNNVIGSEMAGRIVDQLVDDITNETGRYPRPH